MIKKPSQQLQKFEGWWCRSLILSLLGSFYWGRWIHAILMLEQTNSIDCQNTQWLNKWRTASPVLFFFWHTLATRTPNKYLFATVFCFNFDSKIHFPMADHSSFERRYNMRFFHAFVSLLIWFRLNKGSFRGIAFVQISADNSAVAMFLCHATDGSMRFLFTSTHLLLTLSLCVRVSLQVEAKSNLIWVIWIIWIIHRVKFTRDCTKSKWKVKRWK